MDLPTELIFQLCYECKWKEQPRQHRVWCGSFNHRIMHITDYALMVVSRMSGSSTGIEWARRGALYAIKKIENPLTRVTRSKTVNRQRFLRWQRVTIMVTINARITNVAHRAPVLEEGASMQIWWLTKGGINIKHRRVKHTILWFAHENSSIIITRKWCRTLNVEASNSQD